MDEQTKAEFDRLADAAERFQRILHAAGNAPETERAILFRLADLMLKGIDSIPVDGFRATVRADLGAYLDIQETK